jgi:fatty-acyl-CoA synthase/long-chain acyl-CoA synthetase
VPVLGDLIRNVVRAHGDSVATVDLTDGRSVTFAELDSDFNRVAAALAELGLTRGDHVAIFQRNSREWVTMEGALAKSGMVTVPINIFLSAREVLWLLDHSEARALYFSRDELEIVDEIRERATRCKLFLANGDSAPPWAVPFAAHNWPGAGPEPEARVSPRDPQRIMYTSATTGSPKGVICPHEVMVGCIVTALANQLNDVQTQDRLLVATPLTHVANNFFWAFFGRGASSYLLRQFRPEAFCRAVHEHAVTHTFLAPTMIVMLLAHLRASPNDAEALRRSSLRALWYAGSPIPESVAREAEDVLGSILNQQYGLTEQYASCPTMAVTQLPASWHRRKLGSTGRQVVGLVVRVLGEDGSELPPGEVGEIAIRCHGSVSGYWKPTPDTQGAYRDGWIHTGDIGHFDDEGFLYVMDRKNDMIISGGLNVYPAEVESVLHEHPGVYQCAVVGVADPEWIEVPCAVVVRNEDQPDVSEEELIAFAREHIAHFKAPKRVLFEESLPISAAGKILRRRLRERLNEQLKQS